MKEKTIHEFLVLKFLSLDVQQSVLLNLHNLQNKNSNLFL
nr:MAG TPA: hypothetical protein [Caudoviricetes sp.]